MTTYWVYSSSGASSVGVTIQEAHAEVSLKEKERETLSAQIIGIGNLDVIKASPSLFIAADAHSYLEVKSRSTFFELTVRNPDADFVEARIPLSPYSWFGLGHLMSQQWPLEAASLPFGPFYPFDNGPTGVCTLAEPTLICTSGSALMVDESSSCLHIGLNSESDEAAIAKPYRWGTGVANFDRKILPASADLCKGDGLLRIQSRKKYDYAGVQHTWAHIHAPHSKISPQLRFSITSTSSTRSACESVLAEVKKNEECLRKIPPLKMLRHPIWTTWVRFKDAVTQNDALQYGQDICNRDLPRSVLEIDDRWSVKYGDIDFDHVKFPDPAAMVRSLHEMGFLVTLWITPFADLDSDAVSSKTTQTYFVQNEETGTVGGFSWWQPTQVAALDLTNLEACDWFVSRLKRLQDLYGIDGFKFDAGEPCFLPKNASIAKKLSSPAEYSRLWVERVASKFPVSEIRTGVRGCQSAPSVSRIFDRFSTWDIDNGMASVISATLTSGVLGYPLVLPDMIGGNAYDEDLPTPELMIRWTQLNAALPMMQFSEAFWEMGDECEKNCVLALKWREEFFWEYIEALLPEAAEWYSPIVRPLWWVESEKDFSAICDEFLLGDNILVAPIMKPGKTERAVLLPRGFWKRVNLPGVVEKHSSEPITGGNWVIASARLDDMPTFIRTKPNE